MHSTTMQQISRLQPLGGSDKKNTSCVFFIAQIFCSPFGKQNICASLFSTSLCCIYSNSFDSCPVCSPASMQVYFLLPVSLAVVCLKAGRAFMNSFDQFFISFCFFLYRIYLHENLFCNR